MENLYCPMIHGGLNITLKNVTGDLDFNQCCLSTTPLKTIDSYVKIWDHSELVALRQQNKNNIWDKGCWQCERIENSGGLSFRKSLIDKFGYKDQLSGPQRIDLLFDRSCNLACIYCGPQNSTYWQKYKNENNMSQEIKFVNKTTKPKIYEFLSKINLENIEQIQFCGGETLLGNTYLETAKFISELIPEKAKNKFEIAFQTNGTQPWRDEFYEIFERFQLVKIDISLDCVGQRFEYSRWPASWTQVTENILEIREKSPPNVMFLFQEVATNMSLYYVGENELWIKNNFKDNRVTDPTTHNLQLVKSKYLDVNNITTEYVDSIKNKKVFKYLQPNWQENPEKINEFLKEVAFHDSIRGLDWKQAYPEVADFFTRYI